VAGMGPPPKHPTQRRRTNATVPMVELPAEGRQGETPAWPLIPDIVTATQRDLAAAKVERLRYEREEASGSAIGSIERKLDAALERLEILERRLAHQKALEAELWGDLWALPQAVVWERLGWLRDVAQYVRHKVLAELGDLDGAREARQWSDRLGLSPLAMLRLRWEVVADELGAKRDERKAPATRRLKAVERGAG
jgi:hypothetical protein